MLNNEWEYTPLTGWGGAGTYNVSSSPFMSMEELTEYLGKYEETKAKWLEYCYGNYGDMELKVESSFGTGRLVMGQITEEDEGAWTTP